MQCTPWENIISRSKLQTRLSDAIKLTAFAVGTTATLSQEHVTGLHVSVFSELALI